MATRALLITAFMAVASSAGLQWVGLSAQTEAARQKESRQVLSELSTLVQRFATVPEKEKPAFAEHLTGMAERLSHEAKAERLASASRRVVALASFESGKETREKELQQRLRAELRGLLTEAESLESAALGRATWLSAVNQVLLLAAAVLCGLLLYRGRSARITA